MVLCNKLPFAEPLLHGDDIEHDTPWTQALGKWWQSDKPWLQETLLPPVTTHTLNGIDYVGKGDRYCWTYQCERGIAAAKWASQLGWPLLGDVLSQTGRNHYLYCFDLWLNNPQVKAELNQAEIVIQFGSSLTGKRLLQCSKPNCSPKCIG